MIEFENIALIHVIKGNAHLNSNMSVINGTRLNKLLFTYVCLQMSLSLSLSPGDVLTLTKVILFNAQIQTAPLE